MSLFMGTSKLMYHLRSNTVSGSTEPHHMPRTIFFISDGTGITAETLGRALLTQFDGLVYHQITLPFIDTPEKAVNAVELIQWAGSDDGERPVVFSSFTDPTLLELVAGSNALVLDLFSVFIGSLEAEFSLHSSHAKGRLHGMADAASYDTRIQAINFSLQHDDGASTAHYHQADVILTGVSRTGKTPTSIYLAMQFGLRAANYPLTEEDLGGMRLPNRLKPYRSKLYGLTITPERLSIIRSERRPGSSYSSLLQCRKEVEDAATLFRLEGIPHLDTTAMSIEEIASRVMQERGIKRRLF
jgi:regulator of PEP synthase PpsR (kinase-PPPase family)